VRTREIRRAEWCPILCAVPAELLLGAERQHDVSTVPRGHPRSRGNRVQVMWESRPPRREDSEGVARILTKQRPGLCVWEKRECELVLLYFA
jgi:hypothetical protein